MGERAKATSKAPESKTENSASQTKKTNFSQSTNSPVDHILFLQRTVGNQAVEKLLKSGVIQAKLTIGQPGDIYEQEADRIAEEVMRMPDLSKTPSKGVAEYNKVPSIQRTCTECEEELQRQPMEEEEELLQTKEVSGSTPEVTPSVESQINSIKGGGQPLPESIRAFFEPRFGQDFSQVRIHTDSNAGESAKAVNALAYTVGPEVVFSEGQYSPGTESGKKLIAHELTHVVQQSRSDPTRLHQSSEKRGLSPIPTRLKLQRQPAGSAFCDLVPSKDLSPRKWLKCLHLGLIQPDNEDPLRFTFTGVLATPTELKKWVDREGITQEVAIARVMHSHGFAGSAKAREDAKAALINAFPMEKLSVCIRPVQIADDDGKKPTVLPSFAAATTIWGKCCLDLSVKAANIVSKTAFKTLDHEPDTLRATAEEVSLFKAAGGAGGCISVFVAETFKQGGKTSKDIGGGAATFGTPGGGSAVFVVEGVDPTIVAHELGHAMGLGPLAHGPAGTIMEVTASRHDQRESDKVAWVICDKVRRFTSAKPSGKKDCYSDVIK